MARDEESEQIELCDYARERYPESIFYSDHSGIRVGMGLALKVKKLHSENGIPDWFLAEPRGGYSGLMIEMKATGVRVFYKDTGLLKDDDHLHQQWAMLGRLYVKGYCVGFCSGIEIAKKELDWYMGLPQN
jgi:hypothetical protein